MIKQKQLFRHEPEHGIYGDCHRTAIACLLEVDKEQVPHFNEGGPNGETFCKQEREYLTSKGIAPLYVAFEDLEAAMRFMKLANPGIYALLGGKSRTGVGHTVIVCDGEIVWDPSLDDSGIVGPFDEDKLYWLTFFVPLSMTKRSEDG